MHMKFINKIMELAGIATNYALARKLGVPTPTVDNLVKSGKYIKPQVLCELRKIGGLSWKEYGEMLDEEFSKKS